MKMKEKKATPVPLVLRLVGDAGNDRLYGGAGNSQSPGYGERQAINDCGWRRAA